MDGAHIRCRWAGRVEQADEADEADEAVNVTPASSCRARVLDCWSAGGNGGGEGGGLGVVCRSMLANKSSTSTFEDDACVVAPNSSSIRSGKPSFFEVVTLPSTGTADETRVEKDIHVLRKDVF